MEYEGDNPLYYIIQLNGSGTTSREVVNMTLNGSMKCKVQLYEVTEDGEIGEANGKALNKTLDNLEFTGDNGIKYSYEKLIDELDPAGNVAESPLYFRARVKFDGDDNLYTIAKITSDNGMQVCGYRITDITYPYDLIVSPGTALTTGVLDKLVEMLGAYEYFYDIDGRFIFQKKKTYTSDTYTGIQDDYSSSVEAWSDNNQIASKYSYTFEGSTLVSSYQNSPNFTNLKNDYSLWSTRKSASDTEVSIHMRYAIEHKPKFYKPIGSKKYYATKEGIEYYRKLMIADSVLDSDIPVAIQDELLEMRSNYPSGLSNAWFKYDDWMRVFS